MIRSSIVTPTACIAPSMIGCVAGFISLTSSITNSPIPVPYIAASSIHSETALRVLVNSKSSCNLAFKPSMSEASWSAISSLISNHLPRPNVASSTSATLDSTACCNAGAISLERSLSRNVSPPLHIPRHKR